MRKRKIDDDLDDDDVPLVTSDYSPYPWEKEPIAREVRTICDALELPPLDPRVSYELQKTYYRKNQFGEDGRGQVIMTLRCLTESAGNEAALAEPIIVSAASDCVRRWGSRGVELLEALDHVPSCRYFKDAQPRYRK